MLTGLQEAKSKVNNQEEEEELEEESMLETPLDKIEPYTIFKNSLLGECTVLPIPNSSKPC